MDNSKARNDSLFGHRLVDNEYCMDNSKARNDSLFEHRPDEAFDRHQQSRNDSL